MERCGCNNCAELIELEGLWEELPPCPHCGGKLLTTQEAFDKILELKSEIRKLRLDEEWDDIDDN